MGEVKWTPDQKRVIEARNANILVSAAAGSGKTAVLTERVYQKLIKGTNINELLVLTFTNAAAQELKEKILNAIYKALETETDPKRKNHLKNQLIYINRACITTIDAFCFKLVRENFNVLDSKKDKLEAITHVDGTARIQSVTKEYNERFYNIINELKKNS